jgi:phage gpG-like protein
MLSLRMRLPDTDKIRTAPRQVARAMFGEIGQFMVRSAKLNFQHEISPSGRAWRPNQPRTVEEKGHSRILFASGEMNRAIQIVSLGSDSVSVGLTGGAARKGVTHQFGRETIEGVVFNVPTHSRVAHTRRQGGRLVRVGPSTVRAHQRVGTLPEIPARPFLGFSKPRNDRKKISAIAVKHLREAVE